MGGSSYTKDEDSSGYKHSRAWFPSWGKAPGYDSFPWSVKRLREHRG